MTPSLSISAVERQKRLTTCHNNIQLNPSSSKLTINHTIVEYYVDMLLFISDTHTVSTEPRFNIHYSQLKYELYLWKSGITVGTKVGKIIDSMAHVIAAWMALRSIIFLHVHDFCISEIMIHRHANKTEIHLWVSQLIFFCSN